MKSRRTIGRKALGRGLNYEASEGARGGEAVRNTNCQHLGSSGGTAATGAAPTSSDKLSVMSANATGNSGSKSGEGIVTRAWLDLYCDFSTAQQPLSLQSVLPPGVWASTAHRRNSRPGTDSSWQCADTGSQRNAASAKKTFLKYRTPDIDAGKTRKVQSNLTGGATVHIFA